MGGALTADLRWVDQIIKHKNYQTHSTAASGFVQQIVSDIFHQRRLLLGRSPAIKLRHTMNRSSHSSSNTSNMPHRGTGHKEYSVPAVVPSSAYLHKFPSIYTKSAPAAEPALARTAFCLHGGWGLSTFISTALEVSAGCDRHIMLLLCGQWESISIDFRPKLIPPSRCIGKGS